MSVRNDVFDVDKRLSKFFHIGSRWYSKLSGHVMYIRTMYFNRFKLGGSVNLGFPCCHANPSITELIEIVTFPKYLIRFKAFTAAAMTALWIPDYLLDSQSHSLPTLASTLRFSVRTDVRSFCFGKRLASGRLIRRRQFLVMIEGVCLDYG